MYPFCSFLQAVCQLVKHIFTPVVKMTRRLYRSAAILMTGTAVVAVMTFSSAGFAAGGHNALTAYLGLRGSNLGRSSFGGSSLGRGSRRSIWGNATVHGSKDTTASYRS